MAKSFIAILFLQILFTICLSEGSAPTDNNCRIMTDKYDRAALYSRIFVSGKDNNWPGGIVPYVISSDFTKYERYLILDAMDHIKLRSCIKFVEKTNEHKNYISVEAAPHGCSAMVGYNSRRAKTVVNLQRPDCMHLGTAVHELLHSLGFVHEHTRPDRDAYVKVHWENIMNGLANNYWRYLDEKDYFSKAPLCLTVKMDRYDECTNGYRATTNGLPYDYGSIMHYGLLYSTKNGRDTLSLKKETNATIPNYFGMSVLDVSKLRVQYGCKDKTVYTPSPHACRDKFKHCSIYRRLCKRDSCFMGKFCQRTCGTCHCENNRDNEYCESFKDYCSSRYMRRECKRTCNVC